MLWTWRGTFLGALLLFCATLAASRPCWAQPVGTSVAQMDADEAYDPFADYSEFDESSEEEADLQFFKNGRFFTVGLAGGYRGFTGDYSVIWGSGPAFGLFLSYFFDMRFALALGYLSSNHTEGVRGATENVIANVDLQNIPIHLRYYLNTQNVTKGLAPINPYLVVGLSRFSRTIKISGSPGNATDSATAFEGGAGVEIPLMRNKMFLGGQAYYQYVQWPDEGSAILQSDGTTSTGVSPTGDTWVAMMVLGINF